MRLGAFDCTCYSCREKGHQDNYCPNKDKGNYKKKFSGKCRGYGKTCHKRANYMENDKNKERSLA
eukprot:11484705-Ditylum_brightwellii.AAC.1